jgi:hypothetical protein
MALTLTRLKDGDNVEGKFFSRIYDVTFDSSYPTGGEAVSPASVGLKHIYGVRVLGVKDTTSAGYKVDWDYDNQKLIVSFGDNDAGADGVFAQVGNGVSVASLIVRLQFFGLGG